MLMRETLAGQGEVKVTESPQTRVVVVVDSSQVPVVHELAAAHGVAVEQVPERGIEPVSTVTLILVGAAVAVSSVRHALEQHKGGQVIDLRPGAPKAFYRTPDLEYGIVVIVAMDGRATVKVNKSDDMFGKVISTLPRLLSGGGSTEQAARAVTEMFGPDVQVETVESPAPDGDV